MKAIAILILIGCCVSMNAQALYNHIRHDKTLEEYIRLAESPSFDCVGLIYKDDVPKASCILISPWHILTFSGGFFDHSDELIGQTFKATSRDAILNGHKDGMDRIKVRIGDKHYTASQRFQYMLNYRTFESPLILIVMELTSPVLDIEPAVLGDDRDEIGASVVIVGYEYSHKLFNDPESDNTEMVKIAGENSLDSLGGHDFYGIPNLAFADFDDSRGLVSNTLGQSQPLPLEFKPYKTCAGGGVFHNYSGQWYLTGILYLAEDVVDRNSLKSVQFEDHFAWIRIKYHTDWLQVFH